LQQDGTEGVPELLVSGFDARVFANRTSVANDEELLGDRAAGQPIESGLEEPEDGRNVASVAQLDRRSRRRRWKMKLRLQVTLLMLASLAHGQERMDIRFAGTAINTTDPDKPVAAPIEIILDHDGCKLTVSPPLIGSGHCLIKGFDDKSKQIEILSEGPPFITWSGTLKGNLASGTYKVDAGNQSGSFYFAVLKQPAKEPAPPAVAVVPHTSCSPAIESAISGEIEGWSGETIFKLDNGQIWQQAEYDYDYFYDYNPDVTIYETSAGCRMKVEGEDETILVKCIK
jgi:hypothetical protein